MSLPIRYDSTETGAPVVNNAAGAVNNMLIAVFVTGFNVKGITSITVSGGVATVLCPTHGYACGYGQMVKITGASTAPLDGNKQPTLVDANNFTYPAPGVADGTYTATDARRAPLGWELAHTGSANNKIILRRTAAEASGSMLRVVDTLSAPAATTYAIASMVETATDVDTFTGEAPTTAVEQLWMRGAANATPKKWHVVGSGTRAWILLQGSGGQTLPWPYLFGDPKPLYPGDSGRCLLVGNGTSVTTSGGSMAANNPEGFGLTAGIASQTFHRTRDGLSLNNKFRLSGSGTWGNGLYAAGVSTPVPIVGDYYLKTSTEVRARLPELFLPQSNAPFNDLEVYDLAGRKLLCLSINTGNGALAQMMLDLSSDWDA